MTQTLDTLTLRSPDAFVAALPFLVGFEPRSSCVVVWLRNGAVELTQRLDLPTSAEEHPEWLAVLWSHVTTEVADELIAAFVSDGTSDDELVAGFLAEAAARECVVRDVLHVEDGRWRSLLCSDTECCPPGGRVVDAAVAIEIAAEFAVVGRVPLADRAVMEAEFEEDPGLAAEVGSVLVLPRSRSGARFEKWRDRGIAAAGDALAGGADATPAGRARVLVALGDVRVRDTVLWDLLRAPDPVRAAESLTLLLAGAPRGLAAPIGTCCAIAWWLAGDGARARMAVGRALADDPEYSLAALVDAGLRAGLPPAAWRDAMAGVSRHECRTGAPAPGAPGGA
jgi:hypothetical protein